MSDIPEITLEMISVKVEPKVRKLRPNIKVTWATPDFGMAKSCRKQFGLNNPIKYWLWQRRMKKLWKKKNGR